MTSTGLYLYGGVSDQPTRWLEAVDLLFADRDGKRPSIFRVVRDSKNPQYLAEIQTQLQERARLRAENEAIVDAAKRQVEQVEHVDLEK